jgi:phosphoserine phosphatase
MVMIGDGATDLQAKPPADAFIGFGGVVVRESVRQAADWFVTDFRTLTEALVAD